MRKLLVLAGLSIAAFANGSVFAAACAGFVDVDSASPFCPSVAWVKSRGITLGCTDASHYCPNDPVTRLQMAAFLYRLGFQNTVLNGGNAFGATAVLGTADDNAVEIHVDGARAMRYEPNATSPNLVGGDVNNGVYVGVAGASIAGGGAAGVQNQPLAGGQCQLASGCLNGVTDSFGTIGGGAGNMAGDGVGTGTISNTPFATVAGGQSNWASGGWSSVGGGQTNTASGISATVGGGSGNTASAFAATVPGGSSNTAAALYSLAAGSQATIPAGANGSFLWSDSTGPMSLPATAHDEFIVGATNGIGMYTFKDYTHGCFLVGAAASWTCTSDRATKSGFTDIEPRDVLASLIAMPIAQWRWQGEAEAVRHIGPTAQDFRAAFGLGYDDKTIALVDSEGVALAAIKGLNTKLEERLAEKEQQLVVQQREIAELRARVGRVETLRGELALLRDAIASSTRPHSVVTQEGTTTP